MAATVKTRVLIISDTHCAALSGPRNNVASSFTSPLPDCDVLIHCGDLTHQGEIDQYHLTLDMLKEIKAPVKLVIAGNHDLSLDETFVQDHMIKQRQTQVEADRLVQQAKDLWTAPGGRARLEGITFLDEGVHQIRLKNGAYIKVYASPYTPEFYDWGFPYEKHEDRFNTPSTSLLDATNIASHPVPAFTSDQPSIDVLITHGPPYARMDDTERGQSAGCPHLLLAAMNSRPLLHCFGHIHEGWGAERVVWSPQADSVVASANSMAAWREGAWRAGVSGLGEGIAAVTPNLDDADIDHAVFIDVSESSGNALQRGKETLMVNAAIMDVRYRPQNAPFVIDLDLPTAR